MEQGDWAGCIRHGGTCPVSGKRHQNIRRKDGEKLEDYDLRGRRSWGRVGLERQEAKGEGKLAWSRKKQQGWDRGAEF